jgi:hypothetical protein
MLGCPFPIGTCARRAQDNGNNGKKKRGGSSPTRFFGFNLFRWLPRPSVPGGDGIGGQRKTGVKKPALMV